MTNPRGQTVFLQSPETWRELWDGQVFEKGTIEVETDIAEFERATSTALKGLNMGSKVYGMQWCIRRK